MNSYKVSCNNDHRCEHGYVIRNVCLSLTCLEMILGLIRLMI